MFACCLSSAVQSERKPIDIVPREKHANCAASTQKIYIRKDLNSPLIATPTFISDTETDGSRSVEIPSVDNYRHRLCTLSHLSAVDVSVRWILTVLCVMCRSSLLDQGMLVNIQQPVIQSDGTLLLATDSKVHMF